MAQIIQTKTGAVQGIVVGHCAEYRGIPYAEPPVGENRWKAPIPKRPWSGVLTANRFAAIPPQRIPDGSMPWEMLYYKEFYAYPDYLREQSEDCLYLNIWAPESAAEGKAGLPVAFWIHGGVLQAATAAR